MKGDLPMRPTLDCTEPSTWAAAGYAAGVSALQKAAYKTSADIDKRCAANGLQPYMFGFDACPAPCGSVAPVINSFDDVSNCLQCLTDECKQVVDTEAFGEAPLMDQRSDLPALSCQVKIGRSVDDYIYKRLKLQARCQSRRDKQRLGWESLDCTDLEDPAHPQHHDLLGLNTKLYGAISRACQEPLVLSSILDSCGTDVASEVGCLQQAAFVCVGALHSGVFPQPAPPTPTGGVAPSPTPSTTPAPAGKPCGNDDDCFGSVCSVDGICCSSRCDSTCESCLQAHTGIDDGACSPILEGADPQAECDDGNVCTLDSCDGSGACQAAPTNPGAICGDTSTTDCTAPDTCDGNGVCRANHLLAGSQCGEPGSACVRQDTCDGGGNCIDNGFDTAGSPCGSPESECSGQDVCDGAGSCLPNNYAAGTSCGDLAGPCRNADSCDGQGSCVDGGFVSSGTHCGLPATECSGQDTCDGTGACQPNHLPTSVSCGPPANECTEAGSCDGDGRCSVVFKPDGFACGEPGGECSDQDTCNGAGTCLPNHVTPGTNCGDAGNECTIQDVCNSDGQCVDNGYRATGTACGQPATECSEQDTCDGGGNCLAADLPSGTPCGSGLATDCTAPDTCNGNGVCEANNAAPGSNCGDTGNDCTVQDVCDAFGACIDNGFIAAGTSCGDPSDTICTDPDTCDGNGTCDSHDAPTGVACGDPGNECVLADSCDGFGQCSDRGFRPIGTACGSQVDTECDDPNSCDGAGTCRDNFVSTGSACGDPGSDCVVQDTCNGAGACEDQGVRPAGTSCGSAATTECSAADTCDAGGVCLPNDLPAGALCGDAGTECTVQDTCDGSGACADNGFMARDTLCGSPTDGECDNPDSCDGAGSCRANYEISGTNCGDAGTACVNQDVCNGSGTCIDVGTSPLNSPCADDNNPCTDDICGAGGVCLHVPNSMPCDDGVFCNGSDTCSAGGCTLHTGNPCPGPDGDTNCSETCSETTKACSAPDPDGSPCDDKLFCNGTEVCTGGLCVSENIDPCPNGGFYGGDDDNDCQESCDEFTNTCTAPDPDGLPCNDRTDIDNKFCTGGDVGNPCLIGGDCSSGVCADVCTGPDNGKFCTSNNDCTAPGRCSGRACKSAEYTINEFDGTIRNITIQQDRCVAGACVPGAPPCKGDALDAFGRGIGLSESCQDACREATDSCAATAPNDLDCRNDVYCDGIFDKCASGSCIRSGDPCLNTCIDGNPDLSTCTDPFQRNNPGDGDDDCSEGCKANTPCTGWGCIGRGDCTLNDAVGTSCKDGDFCTKGDTCNGSGSCVTTTSVNPCTNTCVSGNSDLSTCPNPIDRYNIGDADSDCSETCQDINASGWEMGDCNGNDTAATSCTDFTYCNGTEACNGAGGCGSSTGDPCGGFIADGDNNCMEACTEPADNTCFGGSNNGQACTTNGNCPGGTCRSGNSSGSCSSPEPNDTPCVDPLYCNGSQDKCTRSFDVGGNLIATCGGGVGVPVPCVPLNTADSNCAGSCRETNDTCTLNDPAGTNCVDGTYCNGPIDRCNGAGSCNQHDGDPCINEDNNPFGDPRWPVKNLLCNDWCREANGGECKANDPNTAPGGGNTICPDDGFGCNEALEHCVNGACRPTGVCCPTGNFTISVNSNSGGTADPAEWPGGLASAVRTPRTGEVVGGKTIVAGTGEQTCAVAFCRPTGNIDLVGYLGSPFNDFVNDIGFSVQCTGRGFSVGASKGWTTCSATGGEDGDGCDVSSCPPAGIGFCEATRPSCSAALNGSGTATFQVTCSD